MLLHRLESTYRYPRAMRPIHFCATHWLHLVTYRLLGDTITDIESKVEDGRRALHMAVENSHKIIAQHLLAQGADANAESADGRIPFQLALETGNEDIVQLLIQGGINVMPTSLAARHHLASQSEINGILSSNSCFSRKPTPMPLFLMDVAHFM